jgi:histidine triad (HIT) family protein
MATPINDCIFCKIIAKQIPSSIIAETDDIIVIKDIAPKAPVHYLILPKKHIQDIQSLERMDCCLMSRMMRMAQQLSKKTGDFRVLINSGKNAGQKVFHLHMHFLAKKEFTDF